MLKFGSKSDINTCYKCTVRLLEDTEILECEFYMNDKGKHLIERVCNQLNLVEMDYFGIRYVDSNRQRHWLDPAKSVLKQVKDMDPILFSFRVKFYPPDPFKLKEEITRYQLYLQLKRDLLHGRLYCASNESALLAAYIVQAEMGDYNEEEHGDNYLGEVKLLLKQTPYIEDKIMEYHQNDLKGQDPTTAESNFLKKAATLDTYGVDPHPVKDHKGNHLYLGIKHCGILTFQGSQKTHHFNWNEMHKLNFEGKMFIIHLHYHEKKHTVGFKCPTGASCRHIWRCAIEQMLFFTLPSSSAIPPVVTGGGFFSFGTKIRYSGRVEKELLDENSIVRRGEEPTIQRVGSLRRKAASVPATPSTPVVSELGYSTLHRSNHSADCQLDVTSRCSNLGTGGVDLPGFIDDLETVNEDTEVKSRGAYHMNESSPLYYLHDSLDSGDLHFAGPRSITPLPVRHVPLHPPNPPATAPAKAPHQSRSRSARPPHRPQTKLRFLRIFLPSFITAAILVVAVIIIILETDIEAFDTIRRTPEMVALKTQYYERFKQYFKSSSS